MSNVLDLVDQTIFRIERAGGVTSLIQCVWVYDRGVDMAALRGFHDHLRRGRLSRRIERSPLPFGRHRWVTPRDAAAFEIEATPRSRAEFDAWLDAQAATRLDAEHGPGWHLAVLPFTDGGAGVSLVASHCITDAVGLCEAVADAGNGLDTGVGWPAAGSRTRWRAVREDARQTFRDLPAIVGAVAAAARFLRRNAGVAAPAGAAAPVVADDIVTPPTATVFVDADDWDTRAAALGGTSNTLLAALAAHLGRQAGRVGADGTVTLTMPINRRTAGDTRANAITNVDITVDPASVTTDLRAIRAATKRALTRAASEPDERWTLTPLVVLIPERLGKRWVGAATNSAACVGASNVGAVEPAVNRPDGTDADGFAMRSLTSGMTTAMLHQLGGMLMVLSGRAAGRVFVSVVAHQPELPNTNEDLRRRLSTALSDFALSAAPGWDALSTMHTTPGISP